MKIAKTILGILFSLTVAACGGGGGGSSAPATSSSTLSGVAAVGYPIANGSIQVMCAGGGPLNTTTNSTGAWQVTISGQTLPCAVELSGGTINGIVNAIPYYSIATSFGTVNVTPLTNLVVANIAGTATPNVWFTGLTPAAFIPITLASVTTALANQCAALSGLTPLCTTNPITTVFTPTGNNIMDYMLIALQLAINNTGVTYTSLLNNASIPTYSAPAAGFNSALTTAYMSTIGSGILTVANAPASVGGTFDATFIAVTGVSSNGITWGEGITGISGIPGELMTVVFDVATNQVTTVIFQRVDPPTVAAWGCSGPALCSGITLNTDIGNVTFVNTTLVSLVGNPSSQPITLDGTLTFVATTAPISATAITTAQNLTDGMAMNSFSPLSARGGAIPYTYSITSGTLPAGLSFSASTGVVSGTPTTVSATANVVFSVRDANNVVASTTSTVSFTVRAGGGLSGTAAQYFTKNAVGNTWTTLQTSIITPTGGVAGLPFTSQYTDTITASSGGIVTFSSTFTEGTPPVTTTGTSTSYIDATGAWVFTVNTGTYVVLPPTFAVGTTWISQPATASTGAENSTVVAFNVTRTVPAGTFTDCLQVDSTQTDPDGSVHNFSAYFSPTAGLIVDEIGTSFFVSNSATYSGQLQAGYIANP